MFLTGPKKEIAKLAIDSLKLTAIEKKLEERESANDLFVHSTIFVVVDQRGKRAEWCSTDVYELAQQRADVLNRKGKSPRPGSSCADET